MLKTARDLRLPPMYLLIGGDLVWTPEDRALMLAYTRYEELLCSSCGRLASICQGPRLDGHVVVQTIQCQAAAALERWRTDNESPEPGTLAYTTVQRPPMRPLPPSLATLGEHHG